MDAVAVDAVESLDASKVETALQAIRSNDIVTALNLLNAVIANAPISYIREYEKDGYLYIKFWDRDEFLYYCATHPSQNVKWIPCAYPKAYYYLGVIKRMQQDYFGAISMLTKCQQMDLVSPYPLLETIQVFVGMKQLKLAITMYDGVIDADPSFSVSIRARAMRGKAVQLIELGQLDDAERILKDSLQLEPANEVALNELEYLRRLRAGATSVPMDAHLTSLVFKKKCASCDKPIDTGQGYKKDGQILLFCDKCYQKITAKRWWELWK